MKLIPRCEYSEIENKFYCPRSWCTNT